MTRTRAGTNAGMLEKSEHDLQGGETNGVQSSTDGCIKCNKHSRNVVNR